MSLFDGTKGIRRLLLAAGLCLLPTLVACTVQPLYGSNSPSRSASALPADARLASISVSAPADRATQEVRNHLVFMLNGGAGEPADAVHHLALTVTATKTSSALVPVTTNENQPTAGTMTLTGTYVLSEKATGNVLARGKRTSIAAYDIPQQDYAAFRAERDAQSRAARELAEFLRLAVSKDLVDAAPVSSVN